MSIRTLFASLSMGGQDHHLVSCRITEALSEVTSGVVDIASSEDLDAVGAAGGTATLEIHVDGAPVRRLSLVVSELAFTGYEQGSRRFRLALQSPFHKLRHTSNIRKFRGMSAKDIVSQVLGEGGISHSWELMRDPPVRKYCVQYRESNFDFVNRLLEFEGIHFVSRDDGSLLLSDSSPGAALVEGTTSFALLGHAGALEGEFGIHEMGSGMRAQTGAVTVNDYNWKTPAVSLLSSESADRDDDLENYEVAAGYRKPDQGKEIAARLLEANRCRARFVRGVGNVPFFSAGRRFQYLGAAAGEYLLVAVTHVVENEQFGETRAESSTTYRNEFEGIPSSVPFRPLWRTPRPSVKGAHTAMVRGPEGEEIHTDQYGRFRAQFHWDRDATGTDEDSRWLRKAQESGTGANLARIGWEVSVAYVHGDPDRPIGIARNINGVMRPVYTQPANMTMMTIKTPTYPSNGGFNELKFDDRAGDMLMHFRAERNLANKVKNDKTETITRDETHVVEQRFQRLVKHDQSLEVGNNRKILVGGTRNADVKGNRSDTIGSNETVKASNSISVSVEGNDTENVGSMRFTLCGELSASAIASAAAALVSGAVAGAAGDAVGGALGGAAGNVAGAAVSGGISGALGGGGASGAASGATSGALGALGGAGGAGGGAGAGAGGGGGGGGLGGALGGALGGGGGGGLGGALGGALGGGGGGGGLGGALGGGGGLGGALGGALGGGGGGLGGALGGALGGGGGGLGGALGGALGGGGGGLGGALGGGGGGGGGLGGQLSVSSLTSLLVGNIGRTADTAFSRTVGGAKIAVSGDQITSEASKLLAEAVGGAKITIARKGIKTSVGGPDLHLVGGAEFRKCDEDLTMGAKKSIVLVGGIVKMETPEALEVHGKEITITGFASLDVAAGSDLAVKMTPDKIAFEGAMLLDAPDKVKFEAAAVDDLTKEGG